MDPRDEEDFVEPNEMDPADDPGPRRPTPLRRRSRALCIAIPMWILGGICHATGQEVFDQAKVAVSSMVTD